MEGLASYSQLSSQLSEKSKSSGIIRSIFAENCVAVVFLTAIILNLVLPKNMEVERQEK